MAAEQEVKIVLTGEDRGATNALKSVAGAIDGFSKKSKTVGSNLQVLGRVMQRTGRVLTVELTAPLLAFGATAVKSAVEADTAFRELDKVFDGTAKQLKSELIPAAQELALTWGMSRIEITGVMEEFAAAGFEMVDIIEATSRAIEVERIGNLDLAQSQSLVLSLMQTFNLRGEELTQTLADLNAVEDKSAARFDDLSFGIGRFGSMMELANVPIRNQASLLGVLQQKQDRVEINSRALRTIMKRIVAPTDEAAEAFAHYGIEVEKTEKSMQTVTRTVGENEKEMKRLSSAIGRTEASIRDYAAGSKGASLSDEDRKEKIEDLNSVLGVYQGQLSAASGAEETYSGMVKVRTGELVAGNEVLGQMAEKWKTMTEVERAHFAEMAGGTNFIDQFTTIMNDLSSETSTYNKILDETADKEANIARLRAQLNIESESLAVKFGQLKERFRVFTEFVGMEVVPILLRVADVLLQVADKFKDLDPNVRTAIVLAGMFLTILGPLLVFLGLVAQGVGVLATIISLLISGPLALIVVAIMAVIAAIGFLILNQEKLRANAEEVLFQVGKWFEGLLETVRSVAEGIAGAINRSIIGPIRSIIDWASRAISKLKELFSLRGQGEEGTPHRQHGGTVPGRVGEAVPIIAHGGERIIPRGSNVTSPFANQTGGGVNITINMTGAVSMDNTQRVNDLAEQIIKIMGRHNELSRYGVGF